MPDTAARDADHEDEWERLPPELGGPQTPLPNSSTNKPPARHSAAASTAVNPAKESGSKTVGERVVGEKEMDGLARLELDDGKRPATAWVRLLASCADPHTCPQLVRGAAVRMDAKHFPIPDSDVFVQHDAGDGDPVAHATYVRYRLWCLAVGCSQYACSVAACPLSTLGGIWHRQSLPLDVYRVNGDPWDDRLANLRLMCPNCHQVMAAAQRQGKPLPLALNTLRCNPL
jgi:hypothetical protein